MATQPPLETYRHRLLAGLPVVERRLDAAGVSTAVLDGGDGPPVVLLHGPGESAGTGGGPSPTWRPATGVVAPDLPAHGSSRTGKGPLDAELAVAWLDELLERTCPEPPVVVGHGLGGAMAARYAARRPGRLRGLVLVDSLGLARFRPSLRLALGFLTVHLPAERAVLRALYGPVRR